jgi:hypothetical protein
MAEVSGEIWWWTYELLHWNFQWPMESCLLLQEWVRGTELYIVKFWNFDSAPYTAVFGTFAQWRKASIVFIMSVCRTVCSQVSARFSPDGSTWNLFGVFTKTCQENPKLIEMWHKRAFYTKINLCFIACGNISSHLKSYLRMKFYQAVRMAWVTNIMRTRHIFTLYVHCLPVCIWRQTEIIICTCWCSQNKLQYTAVVFPNYDCKLKLLFTVQMASSGHQRECHVRLPVSDISKSLPHRLVKRQVDCGTAGHCSILSSEVLFQ